MPNNTAPTRVARLTVDEHTDLLTGYDEDAVEAKFGANYDDLRPLRRLRALVYVEHRRLGSDETEAYDVAMKLPVKELDAYFEPPEEDAMPEEPDTDSGKDDSTDE